MSAGASLTGAGHDLQRRRRRQGDVRAPGRRVLEEGEVHDPMISRLPRSAACWSSTSRSAAPIIGDSASPRRRSIAALLCDITVISCSEARIGDSHVNKGRPGRGLTAARSVWPPLIGVAKAKEYPRCAARRSRGRGGQERIGPVNQPRAPGWRGGRVLRARSLVSPADGPTRAIRWTKPFDQPDRLGARQPPDGSVRWRWSRWDLRATADDQRGGGPPPSRSVASRCSRG